MVIGSLSRDEFKTDILPYVDAIVISPGKLYLMTGPGNPNSQHVIRFEYRILEYVQISCWRVIYQYLEYAWDIKVWQRFWVVQYLLFHPGYKSRSSYAWTIIFHLT